ncbi:MAG: sugar phosphate isomerase/epimerase [Verrucomicrobiaceae bacterium]|nr:MAG: sugar phosphate isomerase/epimerase [Verrucomicrobiaceae bacterium]
MTRDFMKIAMQLGLIPGKTVEDKQKWASDSGLDGIEISASDYLPDRLDQARRDFEASPVPVSSICSNPSIDFLDPDPAKRRASIEESKLYLKLAAEFHATGQIIPPIFGGPRLWEPFPPGGVVALEDDLLVETCKELGDFAGASGTLLLLEPLNRYEEHLLNTLARAVKIIERCGHPSVALIPDFFHMHIEETSTPDALRHAGRHVRHVHLADNTRLEPGTGDINFVESFKVLNEIGFSGYLAFECIVVNPDRDTALRNSLDYIRDCLSKARLTS